MRLLLSFLMLMNLFAVSAGGLDDHLKEMGFIDASTLGVEVELMYAKSDNFTGKILYSDLSRAWLHPEAAAALKKAVDALKREDPSLRLLVKDAARPMSVQRKMFDAVRGSSKANYVANPSKGGGLHNFGLAVDITLVGPDGRELPMGTPVDHLGRESHIDTEEAMVKKGIITGEEMKNRRLLRKVMKEGGFKTIRNEWWHFQMVSRATALANYKRLDF